MEKSKLRRAELIELVGRSINVEGDSEEEIDRMLEQFLANVPASQCRQLFL